MTSTRVIASMDKESPQACVAIVKFEGVLTGFASGEGERVAREIFGALQQKGLAGLARLVINLEGVEDVDNTFLTPAITLLPPMVAALKGAMAFCNANDEVGGKLPADVALLTEGQYSVVSTQQQAISFVREWVG
jgi:hypothetical protein